MMKTSLFLLVGVALWCRGDSLQCYSCSGTKSSCLDMETCGPGLDSCLKLTYKDTGTVYTKCFKYALCDFEYLATIFSLGGFDSHCCKQNLCNSSPSTTARPVIGLLAVLTALWLVIQ